MITYRCPRCAEPLESEERKAGTTVACPGCRHKITVPEQSEREPQHRPPQPPPPASQTGVTAVEVLCCITWIAFALFAIGTIVSHASNSKAAKTVFQQIAVAGDTCAWLLFGFVLARAVTLAMRLGN